MFIVTYNRHIYCRKEYSVKFQHDRNAISFRKRLVKQNVFYNNIKSPDRDCPWKNTFREIRKREKGRKTISRDERKGIMRGYISHGAHFTEIIKDYSIYAVKD